MRRQACLASFVWLKVRLIRFLNGCIILAGAGVAGTLTQNTSAKKIGA